MLRFLIKKLVKTEDFSKKENRDKLISLTGSMGLLINILLFLIKLFAGVITSSVSIIGDSFNNLSDSLTSLVTIFGTRVSSKPADKDHPYGHGRSEYISTLVVGIAIIIVGVQLLINSIKAVINPGKLIFSYVGLFILIVSIGFKIYMYTYNMKVYRMIDSPLNKGLASDSKNDVLATSLVLLSLLFYKFFSINVDGIAGLFLSLLIIKSGVDLFKDMGDLLLGRQIDDKLKLCIEETLKKGKFVRDCHDIELHEYGKSRLFGTAHVEVPVNIDAYSLHEIVDGLEKEIFEKYGVNLSIHTDPNYCLEEDHFVHVNCRIRKK